MITTVIPCWKRLNNLEKVITGWLDQDEVTEVIVFDNSGSFRTDLPNVEVLNSSKNYGPQAKLVAAQFAQNDIILFSDDDVLAGPGLVKDLLEYYNENRMLGIMGKVFTSDTYYTATGYRGKDINTPIPVDYLCGLVMLMNRKYTFVDIRKCPSRHLDDWWLQHEVGMANMVHKKGYSGMLVIPTKKYKLMKENYDNNALHLMPELKQLREKYFKKWIKNAKT